MQKRSRASYRRYGVLQWWSRQKINVCEISASFDDGMLTDPEKFSLVEPIKPTKSFDFIATSPKPNSGAFTLRCLRDCYHGPSHGVAITLVFEA